MVVDELRKAGFVTGAKSIVTPVPEGTWMGKTVNAQIGKIQPRPVAVVVCAVRWIRLAVTLVTRVALRRPLAAAFWSGTRAWLHFTPGWAPRAPPNLIRGILEGPCYAMRGWERASRLT